MIFVLDNIRSGWNVGAIMRTCDALQASLTLVGYTPKPIGGNLKLIKKTAIGAENTVNWDYFSHATEVFEHYKDYTHIAIEISQTSQDLFEFLNSDKTKNLDLSTTCLWLGNEIHGLASTTTKACNYELHLPMQGTKESLNVASTTCTIGYLFKFACQD